jgi:hypothetical protein
VEGGGKYDRVTAISDGVLSARHRERITEVARRWGALAAVAVAGSVIVLITTRRHIGINPDSAVYLAAARNFLDGRGITTPFAVPLAGLGPREAAEYGDAIPLTHFPPLLPVVLAAIARLGMGVESAARWLNATLFGVNLFLVGVLAVRVVQSRIVAASAMILMIVGSVLSISLNFKGLHNTWLLLHSAVMSEPLFLTFTLATLLVLVPISGEYTSPRATAIAAVLTALALLTRYAAIATVVTVVIVVVVWGAGNLRVRRRNALIALAITLLPTLAWTFYNSIVRDASSPRPFRVHFLSIAPLFDVVSGWFVPATWPDLVRHAVLLVAIALVVFVLLQVGKEPAGLPPDAVRLFRVLAIFATAYVAVIVFTRLFLDATAPIDARYLSPLQPVMYILVFAAVRHIYATRRHPQPGLAKLMCVALCLPVIGTGIQATIDTVRDGPTRLSLPDPTVFSLAALPEGTFIATNAPPLVYGTTGKRSIGVPSHLEPLTLAPNENFDAELRELVEVVTERQGVIVLVGVDGRGYFGDDLVRPADLAQFPQLVPRGPFTDGTIVYTTPGPA